MQNLIIDDWLGFLSVFCIVCLCIASIAFGRISLPYIESEMIKEGGEIPEWDKGIGIRAILYALTIVIGKKETSIMLDDKAILKHARRLDWYLALFLVITVSMFFVLGCALYLTDS
jgi:hypothetical protein